MRSPLLLIMIFSLIRGLSQSTHFNHVYEPISNEGTLNGNVFNTDAGYLSIGFTNGAILGREVNTEGQESFAVLTQLPIGFQGTTPLSESCVEIDGHYAVLQGAVNSYQNNYPFLIMLDENIDTVWTWQADWSMGEGDYFGPDCLTQLSNGNLLVVSLARYGYFGGVDSPDSVGYRVTELNLDGAVVSNHLNILPENIYCSAFSFSGARQITNFLLMWGYTFAECGTSDRQNFFLKTNLTGEIIDVYYFGNPDNCMDWRGAATITPENHVVFTYPRCIDSSADPFILHQQQILEFDPMAWQLIADESLDVPDWYEYIDIGNNESLIQAPDGSFVTTGYMYNATGDYPVITPRVFKAKTNGELEWHREYLSGLDSYDEFFFDIANTPDGGYVLTGTVELFPSLAQRHWMVKIDSCGYEQPGFCLPDYVGESEELEVKLWPNPTHRALKAQLPLNSESVILSNTEGRVIFNEKVYHPHQQWRVDDLESGVYFFTVVLEDGRNVHRRFVKE